ncbi:MAG: hypothetical protein WD425_01640 [Nitrospirales bacterium]
MCVIGVSIFLVYGSLCHEGDASADVSSSTNNQATVILSAAQHCPTDLSSFQPRMEKALQFIQSSTFRDTMRASLHASIPEALAQADGLARQMVFLRQEIARQDQERAHAEQAARDGLMDPSQPLKPCRVGDERAYCYAVDQYLVSTAANLANHAFVEALECYQREGVR